MITENTKIKDCDLSIHIKKIFLLAEIETIKDLLCYNITELIKFRGFGNISVKEISSFINSNGFYFKN